ncbi:putative cec-1 [Histomonas meleagridis]|uniref:putative cec-1 n=1 Tax=Histomonas meleagridis TaxID=135588 RepID=UPI00355A0BE1|nr:putative cec-1 [Histomonas meleagridis]KAH0801265.1 putative cec-1 [Histomonas meleagridis]
MSNDEANKEQLPSEEQQLPADEETNEVNDKDVNQSFESQNLGTQEKQSTDINGMQNNETSGEQNIEEESNEKSNHEEKQTQENVEENKNETQENPEGEILCNEKIIEEKNTTDNKNENIVDSKAENANNYHEEEEQVEEIEDKNQEETQTKSDEENIEEIQGNDEQQQILELRQGVDPTPQPPTEFPVGTMNTNEPTIETFNNLGTRNANRSQMHVKKAKSWYEKLVEENGEDEVKAGIKKFAINFGCFVAGAFVLERVTKFINGLH